MVDIRWLSQEAPLRSASGWHSGESLPPPFAAISSKCCHFWAVGRYPCGPPHDGFASYYPSCEKASRSFCSCSLGRLVEMISKSFSFRLGDRPPPAASNPGDPPLPLCLAGPSCMATYSPAARHSSPNGEFPLGDFLPGTRRRMETDPWPARETVSSAGPSAPVRFRRAAYVPAAKRAPLIGETRRFLDVDRACRCSVFWPCVRQFTFIGNRGGSGREA